MDDGLANSKELGKVSILRGAFEEKGFTGQVKLLGLAAYLQLEIMPLFTCPGVPVFAAPSAPPACPYVPVSAAPSAPPACPGVPVSKAQDSVVPKAVQAIALMPGTVSESLAELSCLPLRLPCNLMILMCDADAIIDRMIPEYDNDELIPGLQRNANRETDLSWLLFGETGSCRNSQCASS